MTARFGSRFALAFTVPFALFGALSPGAARADSEVAAEPERYWVEGTDREQGPFTGELIVRDLGDGRVALERRVRYASGAGDLLRGEGRRRGREIQGELRRERGLVGALGDEEAPAPLRFQMQAHAERGDLARSRSGDAQGTRDEALALRLDGEPEGEGEGEGKSPTIDGTSAEGYHLFLGVPFVRGESDPRDIDPSDVKQGSLADCYLMGGLIALARTRPETIRAMITDEGGGQYSVLLRGVRARNEKNQYVGPTRNLRVRMDTSFPYRTRDGEPRPAFAAFGDTETEGDTTRYELWPAMIEKAYATNVGGYERMPAGRAATVFHFVSGRPGKVYETKDYTVEQLERLLKDARARGYPVCFGVDKGPGSPADEVNIIGWHTYALWEAAEGGGYRWVNPWQSSHPSRALTAADLKGIGGRIYVGEIP